MDSHCYLDGNREYVFACLKCNSPLHLYYVTMRNGCGAIDADIDSERVFRREAEVNDYQLGDKEVVMRFRCEGSNCSTISELTILDHKGVSSLVLRVVDGVHLLK